MMAPILTDAEDPVMPPQLVSLPYDPTRRYAAMLAWPAIGLYNWSARAWQRDCSPDCLVPLAAPAGDVPGDAVCAYLPVPETAAQVLLRVVALDAAGAPAATVYEETIGP